MALTRHGNVADAINPQDIPAFHQIADASSGSVVNATALSALSIVNLNDGAIKFVKTFRSFFRLDKTNVDVWTPDGIRYITALGGVGVWVRLSVADPYWATQLTWYWDPISGNDENNGATTSTAIQTHEEFYRRTLDLFFPSTVVINILSNVPDQIFRTGYRSISATYYQAALIEIGSGTFTGVTTLNRISNIPWQLVDSTIPVSWTASGYVGKLLVAKDGGGAVVGTTWIDKDLGSKTARPNGVGIGAPLTVAGTTPPANIFSTTVGTFSVGNTYKVYDAITFAISASRIKDAAVVFYGLRFTAVSGSLTNLSTSNAVTVVQSKFNGGFFSLNGIVSTYQCLSASQMLNNRNSGNMIIFSVGPGGGFQVALSHGFSLIGDCYFTQGGNIWINHGSYSGGVGPLASMAFIDTPGVSGITLSDQSVFMCGQIWGSNNTGSLIRVGFGSWLYTSLVPVATTTSAEITVATIDYTFADIGATGLVDSRNSGIVIGAS